MTSRAAVGGRRARGLLSPSGRALLTELDTAAGRRRQAAVILRGAVRTRLAPAYLLVVAGSQVVLRHLDADVRARVIAASSTNVRNLSSWRLHALLASAVVTDEPLGVPTWVLAAATLVGAEMLWGPRRLGYVFLLGHVGASALVFAGLTLTLRRGWVRRSTATATDVGISYGLAAVLAAHAADLPSRRRPWYGSALLVGGALGLAVSHTFTDTGHLTALLLGGIAGFAGGWADS